MGKSLDNNYNLQENINFFILNSMDDWVRIIDDFGEVTFINDALKEALEKSPKLKNYLDENIDLLLSNSNSLVKSTTMIEEKLIDGKYYSIKSSPIYLGETFTGTIEVYRDITSESLLKIDLYNANKAMLDDIRFVRRIQSSILPKNRTYGNLKLSAIYNPAADVSGDIYDLIRIDENRVAFYIADVMGHGVKASIMTMFLKVTMSAIFDKHPDFTPNEVFLNLRKKFTRLQIDSSQYFTAWLGIFDFRDDSLIFSNAGHNCPPLISACDNEEAEYLLASGRMISNIIEPDKYIEKKIRLKSGDKILFFTDGSIEAKNEKGDEFGLERLRDTFSKSGDLSYVNSKISSYNWQAMTDDLTLALIEYEKKEIK
ncbi:SpoIIE family protein phosphatase [uncultured Anaerococcus sp.]|uniref:SpoIIE family protein phosphatase n=1 Tax=uncultured Anaerococcus sp. TaxID=293428 RepID=UPI00261ACBE9|nr:SpoIIE family protein phosphatase [uncultured Anaerococcus sp.]